MKWLLLIQFILFSMFSIVPIDREDLSNSLTYLERVDVNAPAVDKNPLKPIKDISFKYLVLNPLILLAKNEKLTHQFETREIFNSHLISTQLARSPPSPIS